MDTLDVHLLTELLLKVKPSVQWLCRVSCLSRKWKQACYSPVLWREVDVDGSIRGNLYGEGVEHIAQRCGSLKSLRMFNVHIMERPNPWMHHYFELLLSATEGKLESLQLEFVWELPFTDKLLSAIGRLCPNLVHFKLSAANYFMTDSALAAFLRACPKVQHFHSFVRTPTPIHSPGDTVLWHISKKWPQLETLEINANHVTENGIFGLEDCSQLRILSLHGYNRGVFDRAKSSSDGKLVIFQSLEEVSFTYQLPTASELRRLVRMCPRLNTLRFVSFEGNLHTANLVSVVTSEFPAIRTVVDYLDSNPPAYSLLEVAEKLGVRIDKY